MGSHTGYDSDHRSGEHERHEAHEGRRGYGYGYGYGGYGHNYYAGSYLYPYYSLSSYYGYGNYNSYNYGYGYSPLYNGYYSSYYDYAPPRTYSDYDRDNYYPTYRSSTYYYPARTGRVVTHTNTYAAATRAPAYVVADSYSGQSYASGWDSLSDGRDRTAFRYFSRQASRHIDDGQPKLGYAISSALLGEYGRATWAMRRAFNIDPYSLSTVRFDEQLLRRIDRLAEHYAQRADETGDRDADFMLAALSFLLGDHSLATIAIDNAVAHGDASDAALNLRAMIAETPNTEDDYP